MREQLASALSIATLAGAGCVLQSGGSAPVVLDASIPSDAGVAREASVADAANDAGRPREDAAVTDAAAPGAPDAGTSLCSDDPALVACYPLDGDVLDHGPRGNDLHASSVAFDPAGGVLLNADSQLFCPNGPELSHGARTLLAWVRIDALTSGRAGILDRDREYGIFAYAGGEVRCSMAIAAAGWVSAPHAWDDGRWHHLACVAEAATLLLYVDGALAGSAQGAGSSPSNATPLHLGANSPNGQDQLVGALDDVRIWDTAWSQEQVALDASQRKSRPRPRCRQRPRLRQR